MNAPTAILLFARSAPAEARAKRFGHRGRRIGEALLRHTEATLARTGLPVYRSSEEKQRGADFGTRLARAVREVFGRGHERVLVVGSDCPDLSVATIERAVRELKGGRQVIGPDARGGAYLIGLQRKTFDADAFAGLPWQSPRIARRLRAQLCDCRVFRTRKDYNELGELQRDAGLLSRLLPGISWLINRVRPIHAAKPTSLPCIDRLLPSRAPPTW